MKILITGGAGHVGRKLREQFAGQFETIRVFDMVAATDLRSNEESVVGDIASLEQVERAMRGMDACIHLAAEANETSWERILPANIVGTWNVYEAAFRQGAKRIVFGSSNHAVGFYPRTQVIDHTALARPDSRYGLSKAWGEDVGQLYADKYGVRSMHIRIGNAADVPGSARALAIWVSARDLAQLVRIGLEHPEIHNTIVYGVSRNKACWYDNSEAYRLGYKPLDKAEDYTDEAMAAEAGQKRDPIEQQFQGGPFCAIEYVGPARP
ncbi:NAD(P)-dependent oxidoreductase [Alsobacter sp. SYSU M60028]|uniref:NAD(P)-dependent oxidoreductase n=1 Tax=Alsobacter ponti TaxID=2962936 RepID=A0ABT1LHG9_9HYPH|nr:NAD(P)-dependent oxidoreductase [Alsobacter ponti]MCP8940558.1 NAD(P)-dependent oxidoreductase [Alsobacter ponti]